MHVEITNGKVSIHMDNGKVFRLPETERVMKEAKKKYNKRKVNEPINCTVCGKTCKGKLGLALHMKVHHEVWKKEN